MISLSVVAPPLSLFFLDPQDPSKPDKRGSRLGRGPGDGKASQADAAAVQQQAYQKKGSARRREPRRHTLQNGIDYNMLRRMKQIEQEKDVLMQGLQAIEKAREWYLKQVAAVQEKMKYLGRMGHAVSNIWGEGLVWLLLNITQPLK